MAGGFDITTTLSSLKLPASRTGQIVYTVTNTSGRPLTARVVIVTPQSPDQKAWFSIEGAVERPAPPGVGLQYVVNIAVPPTAPAGTVVVRLDALAKEDPDAYAQQGPPINVEVPPAVIVPPPRQFPWWIVIVGAAVALIVSAGLVAHFVFHLPPSSPSPTPDPAQRFVGSWVPTQSPPNSDFKVANVVITRGAGTHTFNFQVHATCIGPGFATDCGVSAPGTFDGTRNTLTFNSSVTIFGTAFRINATANVDISGNVMTINFTVAGVPVAYTFKKNCPGCGLPGVSVAYPPGLSAGTWVNAQTSPLDSGARFIVVQATASGFVATPYFSACYSYVHWCDVQKTQSRPATYSFAKEQFVFTWSDGSHTIQLTTSFTQSGQMVGVMTFDGGDPSPGYTFTLQ